jgi:drug/metabolite transporter (DMT)-like permease
MGTTGYLVPAVRKKQTLPWIAFAAVCFFWGTTAPAIRVAVRYFPPLLLSAVRFALSGALLLSVLVAMRKGPKNWLTAIRRSVPGGLSLAVANALTCVGLATVQSGQGALLLATTALWMTIIDGLWPSSGRRTSPLAWLGLIFGLGGVGLLLDSPTSLLGLSTGTVVLLVSALGWALGSVWQSRHPSHLPPLQEAALQMLVSAVVLIPAAYVLGERWNPAIPALGWRAFIFLVLTGSLIGFVSFVYILRNLPPRVVGLYTYVNPLVATWAGWWWLDESVKPRFWLASAVILGSVALVRLAESRASQRFQFGDSAADSTLPPI